MTIRSHALTRSFGEEMALKDFSLSVEPGEIHAIVGLNGAGKTTLLRVLLGMLRPDSGFGEILGNDVAGAGPEVWKRVGHFIGAPFAYPELTVRENLHAAARLHGMRTSDLERAAAGWVEQLELSHWADRRTRSLSSGNRQRLGLAAAMIHTPCVIVLDEPSNSLDPAGVVLIRSMLRRAADKGAAILVSGHHLDELSRVADRITLIHNGRGAGILDPHLGDLEHRFFETIYELDAKNLRSKQ